MDFPLERKSNLREFHCSSLSLYLVLMIIPSAYLSVYDK